MAGSAEHDKRAIVAELEAARARLSATGRALRSSLDLPARAKENFKRHQPTWLGGAAIMGFLLSMLPPRKKTVFVERVTGKMLGAAGKLGTLLSVAKIAISFAHPLVSKIAESGLGEILKRFRRAPKPVHFDNTPRP